MKSIIELAREAGWVIRDELHYMDHQAMQDASPPWSVPMHLKNSFQLSSIWVISVSPMQMNLRLQ